MWDVLAANKYHTVSHIQPDMTGHSSTYEALQNIRDTLPSLNKLGLKHSVRLTLWGVIIVFIYICFKCIYWYLTTLFFVGGHETRFFFFFILAWLTSDNDDADVISCAMMRSWHGNTFRITGSLWGATGHWSPNKGPVMRSFDVSIVVSLNMLLNKQPGCCWFETWRLCDITVLLRQHSRDR